jgi:hypothetical protein
MEKKLLYEKDGIRAYETSFPGTDVKEFAATGFVEGPMEVLGEVIMDIPRYTEWMADVSESRVLKDIDRLTKIVYGRIKLPWPIADRDFVVANKTLLEVEFARCIISFSVTEEIAVKPPKKVVRMEQLDGCFKLEYMGADRSLVTYTQKAHPGGSTPPKMANVTTQHYPCKNIQGLRRMARLPVFAQRAANSPEKKIIQDTLADRDKVRLVMKNRLNEFLNNKEIADSVVENMKGLDELLAKGLTYNRLREFISKAISQLFEMGFAPKVLSDSSLLKLLEKKPEIVERMLKDDELAFSMLEHAKPFQDIIKGWTTKNA